MRAPVGAEDDVYLNTGELVFSRGDCLARTLVGSCVAVALYDPLCRMGGLCHYLLPTLSGEVPSTRYGEVALPLLLTKFRRAGSVRGNLRAWIVGGALLLEAHEIFFVGDRNAEFAETFLREAGIKVVDNQTRGYQGRRLWFRTSTGEFAVEPIPATATRGLLLI